MFSPGCFSPCDLSSPLRVRAGDLVTTRSFVSQLVLGVWMLCFMHPAPVLAKAIIEFTDGHRMKVSSYKQEGHKVTVYTNRGSFAFQRSEVAKITNLDIREKTSPAPAAAQPAAPKQQIAGVSMPRPQATRAEETPDPSTQEVTDRDLTKNIQEGQFFEFLSDGMFRLRYAFALLLFVKGLKLFFAAGIH